jgi:hypothetical protein
VQRVNILAPTLRWSGPPREDFTNDPTRVELAEFIDRLNVDEQIHLVALAWIGRGTLFH